MKEFDIIIAGGGMVGVTAALALAKINSKSPLKIALVESVEPESNVSPSFDARAVALSASSVVIYQSLDLWADLKSLAEPILDIHVSEQNQFGFTRLSKNDCKVDALGHVISLNETGPVLWAAIKSLKNITTFCPSEINKIEPVQGQKSNVIVYLNNSEEKLSAKLLIAADGTFSNLAKMADIKTKRSSYAQHAVIANISTDEPHENKAFERFTDQGPLALLPLTRNRMSLVWCQSENRYQNTMTLDDEAFIRELQKNFGFRLGKITKVGERSSYPLSLHLPNEVYNGRILLLGNSAHTLHPIAGQGFNIGLRDIAALVDIIKENLCDGNNDVGGNELLEKYHNQRKADWSKTIGATDSLVRLFSNDYFPLNPVRSKGLWLIDKLPFIKNKIASVAMGFDGDSAKLTRGLK